ncbi:MAG: hypothetical protein HYT72_02685 [Candidatus Aenigmarchaeota archaeon]|nr:hypothetical protein [Candidatus Aenigmarchaeota archaeon]
MQPKHGIVAEGGRRSVLTYVLTGIAGAGLVAYMAFRTLTGGGQATVPTYPERPPAAAPATSTPTPKYFIETADGLARIEFPGLTEADATPFIDGAYQKAQTESETRGTRVPFNGVVTKGILCDGRGCPEAGTKFYNPDSVRLQREKTGAGGKVRVELDCGPVTALQCDDATLSRVTTQSEEAYRFIMETLKPTKDVGIYVTVSADGKRANVTYFLTDMHLNVGRKSQTSFYPWHVTGDFGQMTHETAASVGDALELVSEAFLGDFWGGYVDWKRNGSKTTNTRIGDYMRDRSVPALGYEVRLALTTDGFTDAQFTQLAQRLEGTNARWERFKAEAKVVAGKDLPTLNSKILDDEVQLYRQIDGKKSAAIIKDRSAELARIKEVFPELKNDPLYDRTYYEQFA